MPAPAKDSSRSLTPTEAAEHLRLMADELAATSCGKDGILLHAARAYCRAAEIVERMAAPEESRGGKLLLSQREAAKLLGMSVGTVNTMVNAGKIPVVRLSEGTARIPRAWLEHHIAKLVAEWEKHQSFQVNFQSLGSPKTGETREKRVKSFRKLAESPN